MKTKPVQGRTILLVEDDYTVAMDLQSSFEEAGATVVGPVGRVDDAMGLVWDVFDIDIAVLDINLHGEFAFYVAQALRERGIPFVFASGYGRRGLPKAFERIPLCEKPLEYDLLAATLTHELSRRPFGRPH